MSSTIANLTAPMLSKQVTFRKGDGTVYDTTDNNRGRLGLPTQVASKQPLAPPNAHIYDLETAGRL